MTPSARTNGSKIRSRSSSATPGPSSSTRSSVPGATPTDSVTATAPPPWRAALTNRLSTMIRSPGSQPRTTTGSSGSSQVHSHPGVARPRRRQRDRDEIGELDVVAVSGGVASPRASACSPSQQRDEPAVLRQRVLDHLRALRDRHLGMAAERRQVGLHARQRRAQLVPGVGGEAPRRRQRALAIGRRAPEPREHLVEARRQRAQLGRPVVAGHAAVEVLGARDAGGRAAQAAQRAQRHVGREPGAQRRDEQRRGAERPAAAG